MFGHRTGINAEKSRMHTFGMVALVSGKNVHLTGNPLIHKDVQPAVLRYFPNNPHNINKTNHNFQTAFFCVNYSNDLDERQVRCSMVFIRPQTLPSMLYPANTPGENEIILLLRQNDEKALAYIYGRFHISLFCFSSQFLSDSQAAEDIVAESFIKLWHRRKDFDHLATVRSFLYITVKNACINVLRQSSRHAASHVEIRYLFEEKDDLHAEYMLSHTEMLQQIWDDVEQLPPIRRKIFKMLYLEGLNNGEIARELNISVDTVRVQKARALHTLRAIIKERL